MLHYDRYLVIVCVVLFVACALAEDQPAAPGAKPTRRPYRIGANRFKIPELDAELAAKSLLELSRFGLPSEDNLRQFNKFILSYDRRLRGPLWTIERLTQENFVETANRVGSIFRVDDTLHPYFQASPKDFEKTGYDRGHQVSAGDYKNDQVSMDQSFAMSNVWPQKANLNRGGWVRLETYIRHICMSGKIRQLYVVTGPLFMPKRDADGQEYVEYHMIGKSDIAVPTHFFKVFVTEHLDGHLTMESFVMPNTDEPNMRIKTIEKYRLPVDQLEWVERASGLRFFPRLDRSQVEKPTKFQFDYPDEQITFGHKG